MNKRTLTTAILLSLGGAALAQPAQAAVLADGTTLTITDGVPIYDSNGYLVNVTTGSWFGMDTNGDSKIANTEKSAIDGLSGIVIGSTQGIATIDQWSFFGNAGTHFTTVAPTGGTTAGIDMSGWTVFWPNPGGAAIPMVTRAWLPVGANCTNLGIPAADCADGFTDGVAKIRCYTDDTFTNESATCSVGEYYKLYYTATVPETDPGYANVKYLLHLEGQIFNEPAGTGVTFGSSPNSTPPTDSAMSRQCVGGCFTFTQSLTTGTWLYMVLPLTEAIPENGVFRKYINGAWTNFATGTEGTLKSAPGTGTDGSPATCPAYNSPLYTSGITAGNRCVRLGIKDGGANDADGTVNSSVSDPGGIGVPLSVVIDTSSSKVSGGCSLTDIRVSLTERADWWLLAGFLAWLGALRTRFNR